MYATFLEAFKGLRSKLRQLYDEGEAHAVAQRLLAHHAGKTYTELLTGDEKMSADAQAAWHQDAVALLSGKPLQYVLGYAVFMSRRLLVNEHVLIPRPETEELATWIIGDYKKKRKALPVLDIGTGSGCIAIGLKLAMQRAEVTAIDVSGVALEVARANAEQMNTAMQLVMMDFLSDAANSLLSQYEVIVSNPPYIPLKEKETLHDNVAKHEPATALFVPDEDPLLFYRRIAGFGKTHLLPGGHIYCELHRDYAVDTETMFIAAGYKTELRNDLAGNPRLLKASPMRRRASPLAKVEAIAIPLTEAPTTDMLSPAEGPA